MKICPKCQHENDDEADFCGKCREYLRWERTGYMPAVSAKPQAPAQPQPPATPPAAGAPPAPAAAPPAASAPPAPPPPPPAPPAPAPPKEGGVVVTLRVPGVDASGDAHARTKVDPGSQAAFQALVRNQSGVVDNYSLRVEGIPETWWTVDTPMIYLVPFGSGGGNYEQDVTIRLHPPRASESEARDWPIRVVAVSHAQSGHVAGSAVGTVTVTQFHDLEMESSPQISTGRRSGTFAVAVRNKGNGAATAQLAGKDDEGACTFVFEQPTVQVRRGERVSTAVHVRPPKQIWIGRQQDRRVELTATPVGSEAIVHPRQAIFRQRSWLPKWVLMIIPLLIAAVVTFIMTRPKQVKKTVVPDFAALVAKDNISPVEQFFKARAIARAAHLKLAKDPQYLPATKDSENGKIMRQDPEPGVKVPYDTEVTLVLAQAKGIVKVPDLAGLLVPDAVKKLSKVGLTIGKSDPDDPSLFPTTPILFTNPAAGTAVKKGTPIDVTLKVAKPQDTGSGSGSGSSSGGAAAKVAIPALAAGTLLQAASDKLTKLGLTVDPRPKIDVAKPGTVLATTPAAGAKAPDGVVHVVYSVGYPPYVYQANDQLFQADAANGGSAVALTAKNFRAIDPSWSADGKKLVYSGSFDGSNARIYLKNTEAPAGTLDGAVTEKGSHYDTGPALSPNGKTLAFARSPSSAKQADESELCLTALRAKPHVKCIKLDGHVVWDPIWSPDGKMIVVRERAASDGTNSIDLLVLTSPQANAADPGLWAAAKKPLSAKLHGSRTAQVLSASFAPAAAGAPRLAVAADWTDDGNFNIWTVDLKPSGAILTHARVGALGCAVDWRRPDAAELLIISSSKNCGSGGQTIVARRDPNGVSKSLSTKAIVKGIAWQPLVSAAASGG